MNTKELMEQIKTKASQLYATAVETYDRLNDRDRMILIAFGCVLALLIVVGVVAKGHKSLVAMRETIETAKKDLKDVQKLIGELDTNKQKVSTIEQRIGHGQVNITSYIDSIARQNNIRLVSLQEESTTPGEYYKEITAKATVADISIRKLVHFFYLIENGSQIMEIKRLKIKPKYKTPEYLEVNFWVSTYEAL